MAKFLEIAIFVFLRFVGSWFFYEFGNYTKPRDLKEKLSP
jgi:hypothetical protein